jgi:hypothetical protein
MSSLAMRLVSSGVSGGNPVILTGTNSPLTSICGRLPGEKIKSLTRLDARSIALSKAAAGMRGLDVLSETGAVPGISSVCSLL